MSREFKSTPFASFKKEKLGDRQRAGIFAVCGNVDSGNGRYRDRIQSGAFAKTFQENRKRARHLWNHNMASLPIATVEDLYEISRADLPDDVLEYAPDATGAAVVVRSYLDTKEGNDVMIALDAGAINEMSFSYEVPNGKSNMVQETISGEPQMVRTIKEVVHYESSDVLWGMNFATLGAMSMPIESLKAFALQMKAGDLDRAQMLTIADELRTVLASIEQPKTETENICAPINFGAQLQLMKARLSMLELSL